MVVVDEAEAEGSRDWADSSSSITVCASLPSLLNAILAISRTHMRQQLQNKQRVSLRLAILHLLWVGKAHGIEKQSVYRPV